MLALRDKCLPAMDQGAIDLVRKLESKLRDMPQVAVTTEHLIHAGMYARTIRIPKGAILTGVLIKRTTVLIVSGHVTVYRGDEVMELQGYHVLPAAAGRKQVFIAHADTDLTMLFSSNAKTVETAEAEFTDETDLLLSRRVDFNNLLTVTGE